MKTSVDISPVITMRRSAVAAVAVSLALALAVPAGAAPTDISSTPIVLTNTAGVKPNIMLLMDASDSMGWTHMPDEIETVDGIGSVGYKSSQCNILYYDPSKSYPLPKDKNGDAFPDSVFGAARYNGFGDYPSTAPDVTTVNLSGSFRAYDTNTLLIGGSNDTPQAAYYYVHTGGTAIVDYTSPACKEADTGSTVTTANGTWTKVIVGSTSGIAPTVDERTNFANWYSYYRTRIMMIKSAASLAFTPLTDTFRVGFITVQPKDDKADLAINPAKYLAINDFNAVQRGAWFDKLFSQSPFGASPAREGLARVGRMYAGQHDSINKGMDDDPLQFACQQNFTIMTTDGYWNTQTETPNTGGRYGGPLKVDGVHRIGQADGEGTDPQDSPCGQLDPYCLRPVYDGHSSSTTVVKDATILYNQLACGIGNRLATVSPTFKARSWYTASFEKTKRRTQTWSITTDQDVATTYQTTKTQSRRLMTTDQYVQTTHVITAERYQIKKSTWQTTKTTVQQTETSTQAQKRTYQVQRKDTHQHKVVVQYKKVRQQWQIVRQQAYAETRKFVQSSQQDMKHVWRWVAKPTSQETYDPSPTCPAGYDCLKVEMFNLAAVPTGSCGAVPSTTQDVTAPYATTECSAGSGTTAATNVASCTYGTGTHDSGATDYIRTVCDDIQVSAAAPTPWPCSNGMDAAKIRTICSTPIAANNATVVGESTTCANLTGLDSGQSYVKATCTNAINDTTYPDTACVSTTEAGNVNVTCTTLMNTDTFVASGCGAEGLTRTGNNIQTTCTTSTTFGPSVVAPATCPSSDAGPVVTTQGVGAAAVTRTCTQVSATAYANTASPCVGGTVGMTVTECNPTPPAATNYVKFVKDGTCVANLGTSSPFRVVTCTYAGGANNMANVPVAPGTCTPNDGSLTPFLKVVCNGPTELEGAPYAVPPASCVPLGDTTGPSGGGYIVTRCTKISLTPPDPNDCHPGNTGPDDYIQTDCTNMDVPAPVSWCDVNSTTGPAGALVTCARNYFPDVRVTSCAHQDPVVGNGYVTIDCADDTGFGSAFVPPGDCPTGTVGVTQTTMGDAGNSYIRTDCVRNYVGPAAGTFVPPGSCSETVGVDSNHYETRCTKGPSYNPTPQPIATCTPGAETPPSSGNDYLKTTCTATDVTDYTPGIGFPGACVESSVTGSTVTCTLMPDVMPSQQVATCTESVSADVQPITTRCSAQTVIAAVPAPPCTSGNSPTNDEYWTCSEGPAGTPTVDPTCLTDHAVGNTIVRCSDGSTGGDILQRIVTKTTTTTFVSSGAPVSDPVVVTDTGATENQTACLPSTDPSVQLPSPNPREATKAEVPLPADCTQADWPCSTKTDGPSGSSNSLADVANYYYKTDLRTDPDAWPNKVPVVGDDFATHQHMTTFVVALGVSGTLAYNANYKSSANTLGDFPKIRCQPPAVATANLDCTDWPVWPDPTITSLDADGNYLDKSLYNNPKSIDDFWHTAVNGRGTFFSAKDPATVVAGLDAALNSIGDTPASGAGDAASTFQPTSTNNSIFQTSYLSGNQKTGAGWTGDLQAFTLNPTTGVVNPGVVWSAADLLALRTGAACDNRKIYLSHPGGNLAAGPGVENLVEFAWNTFACDAGGLPTGAARTGLDTTEQDFFGGSTTLPVSLLSQWPTMTAVAAPVNQRQDARGANLVNFLRGQSGAEGYVTNTTKFYRKRSGVLGDMVNSQAVYVGAPFARYQDPGYSDFVTTWTSRTPMVYVGGNDGMLHAYVAATGEEAWAVIPRAVLPNLYKLADYNYANDHQYYVDGSPVVSDVYDGTSWHTILVVGLNAGGKSYLALDVTDPSVPPTALWEFSANSGVCPATAGAAVGNMSDCNVGLTFGKPVISKLGGNWVVMVTSGYNNINGVSGDGGGFLYVLNAITRGATVGGSIKYKIDTGVGTATTPSGLAQINNFVDNTFVDNTTVRAYGGDLLGNIWRFEFDPSQSAQLIGKAVDPGGVAQPITVRPEIAEVGNKPIIFVGTGELLGTSDVDSIQRQSVYGIVDPLTPGPVYSPLRDSLRPLVFTQTGDGAAAVRTITCTDATACARTGGWVADLPETKPNGDPAGERVNISMSLNFGTLIVASNVPVPESCTVGGHGWFNYFNYQTGGLSQSSAYVESGLIAGYNVFDLSDSSGPRSSISGTLSDRTHVREQGPPPDPKPSGKRISWREIVQ